MKTITSLKWISAILLFCISMHVFSQTDQAYYNRLYYLCKVWGFAKYYHTEIAKGPGTINWDDQLLIAVPLVKAATSDPEFNAAVLQMLNSAGLMGTSATPLPPDVSDELNLIQAKDLAWMDDPIFFPELKSKLHDILEKFRPQSNYYVGGGNPTFDTDNQYSLEGNYPSEEKRLLGLFRYWNIYNYFYPYKRMMDQDWDVTLAEFIPKIAQPADELDFHLNFRELSTRVNDSHSGIRSPVFDSWHGLSFPPFQISSVENEMVITQVLPEATTLAVGDIIKKIDGFDIDQLRNSLSKYAGGSNGPAIERSLNYLIMYGDDGENEVTLDNGNGERTVSFTRNNSNLSNLKINTSPIWKTTDIDDCTFGIVDMGRLQVADVSTMFTDLWNTKAIIFDIRNYPNGTLWNIVNYLFPGPIHIADFTMPDIMYPGRLSWGPVSIGTGTSNPYKGKVILLFDERTMSQAEYTCMGLENFQDAIKIGSQTAGADGNVSNIYLPGNITAVMTGLGTFYPDHSPAQRIGIIPDFEVHPTISGIRAGKDEVMEAALDCALLSVHPDYCTSAGNATKEWIASVTLGTDSKTSGSSGTLGYEKFLTPEFSVEFGKSYSILLKPGFITSKFENWAVWIDFNGDEGFDEPGELVFSKARSKSTVSGTVVIPAGLSLKTRMRVSMSSSVVPGPCSLFTAGEVEDYTIIIGLPNLVIPYTDFNASFTSITQGGTINFTDISTNNPTSWSWIFSGGTPTISNVQNPSVIYNTKGTYNVTLTASNSGGTDIETKTGYITVNEPVAPVAEFTADPITVLVGAPVQFTDQSINHPINWEWIFTGGNPATSNAQNPSVTYNTTGVYNVTLRVSNSGGTDIKTKTGYITVNNPVQYCTPSNINSSQDFIKTVVITGAFTNTTGGTGYTIYTKMPNAFMSNTTYPVSLTPGKSSYANYWKIWIDLNKDGDFNDAGELVLTDNNRRGAFSSSIAIPGNASGATRMRISMRNGTAPGPCDNGFVGEVEDYNIILGSSGLKQASITRPKHLKIYPNPVSRQLTIQLNEISGTTELCIFSIEGKILRKERLTSNLTIIDVSKWDSGIYLVRVTCDGFIAHQKFVKD